MADAAAPISANDQRVIDAMMNRGDRELRPPAGVHWSTVAERAVEIGLTDRMIGEIKLAGTRPAVRACLSCEQGFLSRGPQNRLCRRCR